MIDVYAANGLPRPTREEWREHRAWLAAHFELVGSAGCPDIACEACEDRRIRETRARRKALGAP
jgi:hypothetical protein